MDRSDERQSEAALIGENVNSARKRSGLSSSRVARAAGLSRRRLAAIEHGRVVPTDDEFTAIAGACGVEPAALRPPGFGLRVVASSVTSAATGELAGGPALDALLREYLTMVLELRQSTPSPEMTLRVADLTELASALGGTPDSIEARLRELLDTDVKEASDLREAILPSSLASISADGALAT